MEDLVKLIKIDGNKIFVSSVLSEEQFAKTHFVRYLQGGGVLCTIPVLQNEQITHEKLLITDSLKSIAQSSVDIIKTNVAIDNDLLSQDGRGVTGEKESLQLKINATMTNQSDQFNNFNSDISIVKNINTAINTSKLNESVKFEPWHFDVPVTKDDIVYFSGTLPSDDFTPLQSLRDKDLTQKAMIAVIKCYCAALLQGNLLPCAGPLGVLLNRDFTQLLFIDEDLIVAISKNNGGDYYKNTVDPWQVSTTISLVNNVNKVNNSATSDTLVTKTFKTRGVPFSNQKNNHGQRQSQVPITDPKQNALRYTCATYIYFLLTRQLPYPSSKTLDKSISIAAGNFVPLDLMVTGVDKRVVDFVNGALSGCNNPVDFDLLDFIISQKGILHLCDLSKNESNVNNLSDTQNNKSLMAKRAAFIKKQHKKMVHRAFVTKYLGAIIAISLAVIVIAIFGSWGVYENLQKPTTMGLGDRDATIMFYTGIHKMIPDYLIATADHCIAAQPYISRVPQTYIASVMKGALSMDSGISTPQEWLFFTPDTPKSYGHIIYGITNFKIDGNNATLNFDAPKKGNHRPPVKFRGTERLGDFSSAVHNVEYYFVHTVDDNLQVDNFKTTVTLRYSNNKWEILDLSEVATSGSVPLAEFVKDYKRVLRATSDNIILACDKLHEKYKWLPRKSVIQEEKARLDKLGY